MNRFLEQRYAQLTRREQGLLWTTLLLLWLTGVSEVVWPWWQQWQTLQIEQHNLYQQQQHLREKKQIYVMLKD